MTTTPNTTASGAADLTPEIECDCLVAWNRSEFGANQHDTVHPMYLTAFKSGYKAALAASAPAPQPAPMPYPTDAQIDAVYEQTMSQHLRSQDAPAVRRFGRAMFLCAWNAAAPKADLVPDAGKMVPAPLQQGEYLPCPFCGNVSINLTVIDDRSFIMCNSCGACCDSNDTLPEDEPGDVWNRRAARGAAQASPAPVAEDADPHRTDAVIVEQTIALTKFLLSWKWGLEPEGDMSRVWESTNTKAAICWNAACHIQDLLTQTDVLNAVAELDAQAAQPEGGA